MRLFCDLDGVLADFDRGFRARVGREPGEYEAEVGAEAFWARIAAEFRFFADLPLMPDAMKLWNTISYVNPTILTGAPLSIPTARDEKIGWVARYFGLGAASRTIVTTAAMKSERCKPGDVLIDDRTKHREKWEARGGIWIVHRSAEETIDELVRLNLLDATKEA